MISKNRRFAVSVMTTFSILLLTACDGADNSTNNINNLDNFNGLKIKLLVGSALDKFCAQAVQDFNQTKPQLEDGTAFRVECEAVGSGDVVNKMVTLATQLKNGSIPATSPDFPTIVSVDGEIYQNQLIYQVNQLFPGQNYIPQITESPLLANSPMVLMTQADIAPGLEKVDNFYKALATAKNHRDIDSSAPSLPINFVHTAPTRSNSGLQTLVTQFASVSGKRPQTITVADVQKFESQVQQIQAKITRYGISTGSLAKSMVKNGQFWASVGSVYESSVIDANSHLQPGQQSYQAVYPQATFTSNMRAILPKSPWVSADEKAAAEKFIAYLRSAQVQKIATELGLRPGVPGIPLGEKFSSQFGVNPQAKYDSLRPPQPEVVEAMLKSWQEEAKKPSLVVVVVDSSGSMEGEKLPAVQRTLQTYINSLGPKEQIALIDFDQDIRPPVLVDGTPEGREKGMQFVNSLEAGGGTRLYDAAISARNWLTENLRKDAINAVLILTDGEDTTSETSLEQLKQELQKSGFNSDERIAFFTVGYGDEREFNPEALQKIAELNGGYYSKGNPESISKLMSDLQLEF